MKNAIPARVKASSALAHNSRWQGDLPIAGLQRLADAVGAGAALLRVDLQLGRDADGAPWLHGTVDADLELACQRCLRRFAAPLHLGIDLRLVYSEAEERRVLAECEPWLVEDDQLPLQTIVEDEVLLGLPIAPRCADCP